MYELNVNLNKDDILNHRIIFYKCLNKISQSCECEICLDMLVVSILDNIDYPKQAFTDETTYDPTWRNGLDYGCEVAILDAMLDDNYKNKVFYYGKPVLPKVSWFYNYLTSLLELDITEVFDIIYEHEKDKYNLYKNI